MERARLLAEAQRRVPKSNTSRGLRTAKPRFILASGLLEVAHSMHDIRYAFRMLRKSPGFTILVVLILALGIGANTGVFSVVNSVLLNPLPYPDADRLVLLWETNPRLGVERDGPSGPNYLDWKEQNQSFADMALLEIHILRIDQPLNGLNSKRFV